MRIEERIRDAIAHRVGGVGASEEAWASIERRIRRAGIRRPLERAAVAAVAVAVAAGIAVGLWVAFRPAAGVSPASEGSPTPSPSPVTICFKSTASGDFDGDGTTDTAILDAEIPGIVECTAKGAGTAPSFELEVEFGSGGGFTQPFPDCQIDECHIVRPSSYDACTIDHCHIVGATDFNADGHSELVVTLGPGAALSYDGVYGLSSGEFVALDVAPPGDPDHGLPPGPIQLGGENDSAYRSGFSCEDRQDGRTLVQWEAEDVGPTTSGPWNMHLTYLRLQNGAFVVTGTDDRKDVTNFPPTEGLCPS